MPTPTRAAAADGRVTAETVMMGAAARASAVLAPLLVATAWWLRGPAGAVSALGGVALVVGVFLSTGWSLRWAAGRGPAVLQTVAVGGFVVRLALYALGVVLLAPLEAIDGHALAASTAVALVALLGYEAWLLSRRSELWWIDPGAEPSGKDRA